MVLSDLQNKIKTDLTNKWITSLWWIKPTQADVNEFQQTWSFSKGFYNNAQSNKIQSNDNKIFGNLQTWETNWPMSYKMETMTPSIVSPWNTETKWVLWVWETWKTWSMWETKQDLATWNISDTANLDIPTLWTPKLDEDLEAKTILDNIFKSNNLTQEQKDYYNNNVFNTPEERKKFLSMTDSERQNYLTNISEANKVTRDFNLKTDYEKTLFDSKMADAKAQADLQNRKAKSELEAQANNFAIAQWTSWRLQSRNLQSAINEQLDLWKQTYENLVASNDRYLSLLAQEYKYQNTVASNEYNDTMSKLKSDLLWKIESLQKTWAMQTANWLLQAKDFIQSTLSAWDLAMKQYSYNLQVANERVKSLSENLKEVNKIDTNVTKLMNDWFLYNSKWWRVADENWQPLKVSNSSWALLTDTPITLNDWSKAFVYQNADWTQRIEKIEWTSPIALNPEILQWYVNAINNWSIKPEDLKNYGLPQNAINEIVWQIQTKQNVEIDRTLDLWDRTRIYYKNWDYEEIMKWEAPKIQKIWTDEYWNDIFWTYNTQTQSFEPINTWWWVSWVTWWGINWDLSQNTDLISKYQWEASFKNNNPTWLTWGISNNLKKMFDEAWISYEKGTARPKNEWGNYIKFATIEDWLNAYTLAFTQAWTDDIYSRLKQWKSGNPEATDKATISYADSIIANSWIAKWTKFSELDENQLNSLLSNHLQRESPALYKELSSWTAETTQEPTNNWDYSFEQQAIMDEYLKSPSNKNSINALKRAWLTSQDIQTYKESSQLSPDDVSKLSMILKNISWTAVNENERAIWNKSYKQWRKEWRTDQDIQDRIAWYYVFDNNEWNKTIKWTLDWFKKYIYWVNDKLPAEVWQQINLWNYSWALQTLENARFEKAWLENPQANASQILDKYNKLEDYIEKYWANFWPLSWKLTWVYNKYLSWDPEYQKMLADLRLYIAEYRNQISWTAITASETDFLDDVIATINDKPANALWKIKAVKENVLNSYNAYRTQAWLPRLNDNEIRNVNSRLNKYTWKELFKTKSWTTPTNNINWQSVNTNDLFDKYYK